ncbi:hypothetical protein V8E53_006170 [Lactarius tabidus]
MSGRRLYFSIPFPVMFVYVVCVKYVRTVSCSVATSYCFPFNFVPVLAQTKLLYSGTCSGGTCCASANTVTVLGKHRRRTATVSTVLRHKKVIVVGKEPGLRCLLHHGMR